MVIKVAVGKSLKTNPGASGMRCLWEDQSTMRWNEIDFPRRAIASSDFPVPEGP